MAAIICTFNQAASNVIYKAPRHIDIVDLDDSNAHSYTVPDGCNLVVINPVLQSSGQVSPVYANFNGGTAAAPTDDVTDGTASDIINGSVAYMVGNSTVISFLRIAASDIDVHINCYTTVQG